MKSKLWLGFILGLIAFSCTKQIELPEVNHDPKLAVFAEIHNGSVRAFVSNSVLRDDTPPDYLFDAEVILKNEVGDSNLLNFESVSETYWLDNLSTMPGENYQLKVKHADYPTVSAITSIPAPVSIDSMEVSFIGKRPFDFDGNGTVWLYEFKIYLKEIGAGTPFLSLLPSYTSKTIAPDSTVTYSNNSGTNISGEGINFSSTAGYLLDTSPQRIIDSKTFSFIGEYYIFEENTFLHEVRINLGTVSDERQRFLSFVENQSFLGEDLFILDPFQVEGNIENGYGLFDAFVSDDVSVVIE